MSPRAPLDGKPTLPSRPPSPRMERRAKQRRRMLAAGAVAIVAVPALAATEWPWGDNNRSQTVSPMAFERAETNFPGSALYYVDLLPAARFDTAELRSMGPQEGATIEFAEARVRGEPAPAFQSAGSGLDKARALQCLSMAIYYEAASESRDGQRAVAQVVLNRVAHPAYPASVCGVVFQGSQRSTGCQFTFTCDGSLARRPMQSVYARAQSIALAALSGEVFSPVGTATHYHTHAVNPYWASSLDLIGSIGAHRFYRWKGRAGRPDAFSMTYRGGEPTAAIGDRSSRTAPPAVSSGAGTIVPPPPAQVFDAPPRQNAPVSGTAARIEPPATAAPAASPDPGILPESGNVRPEYRRSGAWIRQPGSKRDD